MTSVVWGILWAGLLGAQQQAAPAKSPPAAASKVVLIEGENVRPEEAMVFTRSKFLEDGPAVSLMSEFPENLDTVRFNINTYRIGYSLPAVKTGERYAFRGPVKGWRAPNTGAPSVWPPVVYPATRREVMRRAKLLEPIAIAQELDEMKNLRVYYLPTLVGHDGRQYKVAPLALAFFIHRNTGHRMTVALRNERTYGAVSTPLTATTNIYVADVATYSAGFLGIGRARVPKTFYSKAVSWHVQPFEKGDSFDLLMTKPLDAQKNPPLSVEDFQALFQEMTRYTGGPVK